MQNAEKFESMICLLQLLQLRDILRPKRDVGMGNTKLTIHFLGPVRKTQTEWEGHGQGNPVREGMNDVLVPRIRTWTPEA